MIGPVVVHSFAVVRRPFTHQTKDIVRNSLRALALTLILASCSDGGTNTYTGPTTTGGLSSVSITTPSQSVVAGQSVQLSASPKDESGYPVTASVEWSSSSSGVATVSGTGLVTGIAAGTVTITAAAVAGAVTITGNVVITVTAPAPPPVLTSVTVAPSIQSIFVGSALTLVASPKDQNGNAIAATVTWGSSATGVATVDATGGVTAVSAGTATITATAVAGGVTTTGTSVITVSDATPVLTSVVISGPSTVSAGSTITLSASPRDQNGGAIAARVRWTSATPARATIDVNTGVLTGVSAGTSNITASATANGVTETSQLTVTVTAAYPALAAVSATTAITFSPASVDISAGGTVDWTFETFHNVTFLGLAPTGGSIGNTSTGVVSRTFTTAGTYNYTCTIHPGMNGTVIVH
jgi:uncharacterized protein YjdB